jgi:recombination protein RecA
MAKQKKEANDETEVESAEELTQLFIKELNKGNEKGKIAWNLSTDLDNPTTVTEFISTGSSLLNYIIANRPDAGIPVGKLTEISGEEATGKSLIVAHLIKETQKKGGLAVLIDTENSVDPDFLRRIGVDVSQLVYLQPETIEDVGEAMVKVVTMARAKTPDKLVLIAWDSVAGTPSQAEIEGDFDPNDRIGVTAKALGKMMRKLVQVWGKERIALVITNQLRMKMGASQYEDPLMTPGGKAIPFFSTIRLRLQKVTVLKRDGEDDPYGVRTRAKVVKDRIGPPLRKCEFDITFESGIDDIGSWFNKLDDMKLIRRQDGWCYMDTFKGKENPKHPEWGHMFREKRWNDEIRSNPALKKHVQELLREKMVVVYNVKPDDQHIDPDSLMDVEAVKDLVTGNVGEELGKN